MIQKAGAHLSVYYNLFQIQFAEEDKMTYNFTIQQQPIYGTFGEFSVGVGVNRITAKYLLTKIKPGNMGSWENHLASQMAPWREIFQIEELSFDELIQRDLDDSRVAHDLIPYLLGETGHHARFFPPILAVLVPKKMQGSGIAPRYPQAVSEGTTQSFGDLFTFSQVKIDGALSPLGEIRYNSQKTAMVIVDGQHRAMAVLALHRQINNSWGANTFAPYYNHIEVLPEAVAHIELPVCVIYFPEIDEVNISLKDAGIDLISVSREIFTIVNKNAKPIGKSRELLLNDEDFSAFMMRRTLTKLKGQSKSDSNHARIFSFAFGDEENGASNQAMSGRLEYSSAVTLHKMHSATGFAIPGGFSLLNCQDITNGIYIRNSTRPKKLLTGESDFLSLNTISKQKAKSYSPALTEKIVSLLGDLTDLIVLPMFDELRPFVSHNSSMRKLFDRLNDPVSRADLVQSKCKSLLFEGSGVRSVFEEHTERLKLRKEDLNDNGQPIPTHLEQQISYCNSVFTALDKHQTAIKLDRAYELFGIDPAAFENRDFVEVEKDKHSIRLLARSIFDTVSTQAFQIGYLMAALTAVERINYEESTYESRLKNTEFISKLYLTGFNSIFSISATRHRTISGFAAESRAHIFDQHSSGFRGLLLACNVRELNEKQWEFFRYLILEVIHSEKAFSEVNKVLTDPLWSIQAEDYRRILPSLLSDLLTLRKKYISSAVNAAINSTDFAKILFETETHAKAEHKSDDDIRHLTDKLKQNKQEEIEKLCIQHIQSSIGKTEKDTIILSRFGISSNI
jgi:hypothetical protein